MQHSFEPGFYTSNHRGVYQRLDVLKMSMENLDLSNMTVQDANTITKIIEQENLEHAELDDLLDQVEDMFNQQFLLPGHYWGWDEHDKGFGLWMISEVSEAYYDLCEKESHHLVATAFDLRDVVAVVQDNPELFSQDRFKGLDIINFTEDLVKHYENGDEISEMIEEAAKEYFPIQNP